MQFMMLMIPDVYRGNKKLDPGFVPDPKKLEEMARFNEELGKAVKILSLNGLHPLNTGARVSFGKGKPTVTDGPFIESKEVLGGYWLVEANSKEELVKWAQRCPADEGDVIEIRQIFDAGGLRHQEIGGGPFLDLVPKGRDEDGFKFSMEWLRRHDQYRSTRSAAAADLTTSNRARDAPLETEHGCGGDFRL